MIFLVLVLLLAVLAGGTLAWRWWQRERVDRLRDQARLQAVEGQMVALRTALRINVAEHTARHQMRDEFVHSNGADSGGNAAGPWYR